MTGFDHDAFMRDWRGSRLDDGRKIAQAEYDLIMSAIAGTYEPRLENKLEWIAEARRLIGLKEIAGPQHNGWIVDSWQRLGAAWFNDDETPWCGLFVAHCIDAAGLAYPEYFPRARAWADWGVACPPMLGAVAVFGREGGGHVAFPVGQSETHFYCLGGNQRNEVNIMPIAKDRLVENGMRWTKEREPSMLKLPLMTGGIVSEDET